jgi:ABC-type antimicrobial peptide transport system permease subunit
MLAAAGLYAAIASAVVARRRELGLRLALGATPSRVGGLMLRHALQLTALGIALGAPCAWLAAAALRRALFGVAMPSGLIVVASGLALVAVAVAAASVPSTSAMRTDPASLLRSE